MFPLVDLISKTLSILTIVANAAALLILFALVARTFRKSEGGVNLVLRFFGNQAVLFSFGIALASVASSLFYSGVAGFEPCTLCWWQRIFLYPQAIILGIALWRKDERVGLYSIVLSAVGGIIALYHSYLQFGGSPLLPCSATGVSCASRYFLEFGYVTIPTMALSAFVLIILMFVARNITARKNV